MSIRKFKNGNIVLQLDNINMDIDSFYNDVMFWSDLYFNQIEGYMYLCDINTHRMYDCSECYINVLVWLEEELIKGNGKLKLYPIGKRDSNQLFIDLDNGM